LTKSKKKEGIFYLFYHTHTRASKERERERTKTDRRQQQKRRGGDSLDLDLFRRVQTRTFLFFCSRRELKKQIFIASKSKQNARAQNHLQKK
jgi:hypothetical protein